MAAKKSSLPKPGVAGPGRNAKKRIPSPATGRKRPSPAGKETPPETTDSAAGQQTDEALSERLEELQAIHDRMFDGLLIADLETKGFLRANTAICGMLGYSEEELLRMSVVDIHPPDELSHVLERFAALARSELSVAENVPFRRKDGSTFYADVAVQTNKLEYRGRPCLIGFIRDVTERRRAQEALLQGKERFRLAAQSTSDLIYEWDIASDRLDWFGDVDGVLGFDPGEFPRTIEAWVGQIHPDDRSQLENSVRQHRQSTDPIYEEYRIRRKDGTWRYWIDRGTPILDKDGRPHRWIGACIDVTERKHAREELTRHRDHLEELVQERTAELAKTNQQLRLEIAERKRAEAAVQNEQRLLRELLNLQEQDRKLAAYEIHDGLAQQLTGAQMTFQAFSQLQNRDPGKAQGMFDKGLQLLGDALLETRRLISGLRPPILDELGIVAALNYLVCECEKHYSPQIEFHHDVQVGRPAPPLEAAVFRIVQESLANACRHSRSEKVRVELTEKGGRLRAEIRDWGIGFDPHKVEQNRFGLRGICERARLLGGQVTIDTAPNKGTRITVELPMLRNL